MKTFIGVKIINAVPESRVDEFGEELPGYQVTYEDGYVSWSPKETFDKAYREISSGCMTFGLAIEAAKIGQLICRDGWNGKGLMLSFVPEKKTEAGILREHFLIIDTVRDSISTWAPSVNDALAEDWSVVKTK